MAFLGANTDQVRAFADRCRSARGTLETTASTLDATVMAAAWEGEDADALRSRWKEVSGRISDTLTLFGDHSARLTTQADEQDRTSDEDGATSAGSAAESPAEPASGSSERSGTSGTPGAGSDSPQFATDPEAPKERIVTPPTSPTIGDVLMGGVVAANSAATSTTSVSETASEKVESGPVSFELSDKATVAVTEHADGSRTYEMSTTLTSTASLELEGKYASLAEHMGSSAEVSYAVTVPAGMDEEDAALINPLDPSTMPPGTQVTLSGGTSTSAGGEVEVLDLAAIGGSHVEGESQSTVVARAQDGSLSVLTGPTSEVGIDTEFRIGVDGLEVEFTNSSRESASHYEYAQFADTPEGRDAYLIAAVSGEYPADTSTPGVTDRYSETRSSSTLDSGYAVTIGAVDISSQHNIGSDELIVRSYPDGDTTWAQQTYPAGTSSGDCAIVTGGTDMETEYTLSMTPQTSDESSAALADNYGHDIEGITNITFTQDEVDQLAANGNGRSTSAGYSSGADYLTAMAARSSSGSIDDSIETIVMDYNGTYDASYTYHPNGGETEVPGDLGD